MFEEKPDCPVCASEDPFGPTLSGMYECCYCGYSWNPSAEVADALWDALKEAFARLIPKRFR